MRFEWATFDCYGTLIDWERGITDALLPHCPPGTDRDALAARYIELEKQVEAEVYRTYREVLDLAGRRLLEELGRPLAADERSPLPGSLPKWPPFLEVPDALTELRRRGYKLAILSNVDRDLLAASVARLGVEPDLAVTAQDAGSYKPAPGTGACSPNAPGPVRIGQCTSRPASTTTSARRERSGTPQSGSLGAPSLSTMRLRVASFPTSQTCRTC
jgi:2-haloalkanoic acid dehalogenase type II